MKMIKIRVLIVIIALILCQPGFSQTVEELYSPYFLSLGLTAASLESPVGDILNPAVSGLKQRMTLDLSYIALPGLGDEDGFGHAANLGITYPTRAGVISGSLHMVTSSFPSANLGTMGAAYVSFSKDLFPNFLVGAGIGSQFGTQDDYSDVGIGLDLGFLHIPGDVMFLKEFQWGIALRGLGRGYVPPDDTRLFPAAFTPSIGANFKILSRKNLSIALLPDLSFPGVLPVFTDEINMRAALGVELTLFDFLFLDGSVAYDLLENEDDTSDRPFYTFGGAIRFKLPLPEKIKFLNISERGWDRSEVKANIVAVPLQNGVWGIGGGLNIPLGVVDNEPPEIILETSKEFYVSPNLDGVQDDIVLPVTIKDSRFVKGYRFVISDEKDTVVKEIENKEARPENVDISGVMDRLLYVKKGIEIPETIRWDGKSNQGTVVPDGKYNYYMESWDDNGNIAKSPTGTVHIDSTAPAAEVGTPYTIFSPNNDGNKDTLPLQQSGSSEDKWTGVVIDMSGAEVMTFTWENKPPENFEWDGTNAEGMGINIRILF